ncbi:MAG: biotin--[acetyl-CoA-carboxylase] ligase [Phormidesmis sp.]
MNLKSVPKNLPPKSLDPQIESLDPQIESLDLQVESLDLQKIEAAIAQNGTELGICPEFAHIRPQVEIHTYKSLPSTNTQLWKLLAAGAKSGTVVVAQQQSAGKGQRNRQWESSPGGLYLSLALEPNWPVSHSAQLTCLSAWGLATAFNNLGIAVKVKWPNDLFFQGKKLGGILTETKLSHPNDSASNTVEGNGRDMVGANSSLYSQPSNATIKQAVIGVGINWHNSVPESGISLTTILETVEIAPKFAKNKINCLEVLIALAIRGILQGVIFQQQVGSQVFMKSYRKLLTQIGQSVSLDGNGNLSLATPVLATTASDTPTSDTPASGTSGSQSLTQAITQETGTQEMVAQETGTQTTSIQIAAQQANRSGEVVGVSEEGYLQVALHSPKRAKTDYSKIDLATVLDEDILLLRPSEIRVS